MIFDLEFMKDEAVVEKEMELMYKSMVEFAIDNNEYGLLFGSYMIDEEIRLFDIPQCSLDESGNILVEVTLPKGPIVQGNIPIHFVKDFRKYDVARQYRCIFISSQDAGAHAARMKISAIGRTVTRDHHSCYSIGVDNTINIDPNNIDSVEWVCAGNVNDINISTRELNDYKLLYLRNYGLMQAATNPDLSPYVGKALLRDEDWRYSKGYRVDRGADGYANVYNKDGSFRHREDILGNKVYNYGY